MYKFPENNLTDCKNPDNKCPDRNIADRNNPENDKKKCLTIINIYVIP